MCDSHLLQHKFCDTCEWDTHLFRNLPHTHQLVNDYTSSKARREGVARDGVAIERLIIKPIAEAAMAALLVSL